MKTLEHYETLKNIPTKELSEAIEVKDSMARKYKSKPHVHTPNAIQAEIIFRKFHIPHSFWLDIKSFINSSENDTKQTDAESSTHLEKKVS